MLSECTSRAPDRSSRSSSPDGRRRPAATLRLCFMSRVFCAAVIYCGMNDCETVYERVYEETQSANTQRWRRDAVMWFSERMRSWSSSISIFIMKKFTLVLEYTWFHEFTLTYNQSKGHAYLSCCLRGGRRPFRANLMTCMMSSRRRN